MEDDFVAVKASKFSLFHLPTAQSPMIGMECSDPIALNRPVGLPVDAGKNLGSLRYLMFAGLAGAGDST
jgi:hypothetical protein